MMKSSVLVGLALLSLVVHAYGGDMQSRSESTPQIKPWAKPEYPESRAAFIERFKQSGYALVCGVKESRECMGFTNNCLKEIDAHTDQCVSENRVALPEFFSSIDEVKPVNRALFACVAEKQRQSGKGQISIEACNKLNELRKQSSTSK